MAISPTVNAFIQQGNGQEEAAQGAEQLFNQQFTSQAYNTLRAKYPAIMNFLVTFKILSSDLAGGSAFGVFIISNGSGILYLPVVMSAGSITSCEMAYDAGSDQFFPLTEKNTKDIVANNKFSDPKILADSPHVEDTRALFRNMVRPPVSSNVVLAGERSGISGLPDKHKQTLYNYFTKENPQLLGKIAAFMDVRELAHKLALAPVEKLAEEYSLPEFLRVDALTKEAMQAVVPELSAHARKHLLAHGYTTTKLGTDTNNVHVFAENTLGDNIENVLRVETYPKMQDSKLRYKTTGSVSNTSTVNGYSEFAWRDLGDSIVEVTVADILGYTAKGPINKRALLTADIVATEDGVSTLGAVGGSVLISDKQETVSIEDLKKFYGVHELSSLLSKFSTKHPGACGLLVPARVGKVLFTVLDKWSLDVPISVRTNGDGSIDIMTTPAEGARVCVLPNMEYGCIREAGCIFVPKGTLLLQRDPGRAIPTALITSIDQFRRLLCSFGTSLVTADNGAGITITDKKLGKSASFASNVDAAEWLYTNYKLADEQADFVLRTPRSMVFSKQAFMEDGAQDAATAYGTSSADMQGVYEQPAPGLSFDRQPVEDVAEIEDPELFEAGVLASFSQDPDIKSLLVEYLPDFMSAQDRVGRILLLFSYQKTDIEDFYGAEKYASVLSSCRKIFRVLGDLVSSLKTYINMAQ